MRMTPVSSLEKRRQRLPTNITLRGDIREDGRIHALRQGMNFSEYVEKLIKTDLERSHPHRRKRAA